MRFNGPVRFILDSKEGLNYTSLSRVFLQQTKDRMGLGRAYWTRKLSDGTEITVSDLGNINQIWIKTKFEDDEETCSALGYNLLVFDSSDSLNKRFHLPYPDYLNIFRKDTIESGNVDWISDETILTWNSSGYNRYLFNGSDTDIFYRGCIYSPTPGTIIGVAVSNGHVIIVTSDKKMFHRPFSSTPYNNNLTYSTENQNGWREIDISTVPSGLFLGAASADTTGLKWTVRLLDEPFDFTISFNSSTNTFSYVSGTITPDVNTYSIVNEPFTPFLEDLVTQVCSYNQSLVPNPDASTKWMLGSTPVTGICSSGESPGLPDTTAISDGHRDLYQYSLGEGWSRYSGAFIEYFASDFLQSNNILAFAAIRNKNITEWKGVTQFSSTEITRSIDITVNEKSFNGTDWQSEGSRVESYAYEQRLGSRTYSEFEIVIGDLTEIETSYLKIDYESDTDTRLGTLDYSGVYLFPSNVGWTSGLEEWNFNDYTPPGIYSPAPVSESITRSKALDFDIRYSIGLFLKCVQDFSGTTVVSLYWKWPAGQALIATSAVPDANVPFPMGNPTFPSAAGTFGTSELFPSFVVLNTSRIVPNNDELLLYVDIDFYGTNYKHVISLYQNSGTTVETLVINDPDLTITDINPL